MKRYIIIAALLSLSVASGLGCYWLGKKNASEALVGLVEQVCTRQGIIVFDSGRRAMCFGIPADYPEQKKPPQGVDKFTEV